MYKIQVFSRATQNKRSNDSSTRPNHYQMRHQNAGHIVKLNGNTNSMSQLPGKKFVYSKTLTCINFNIGN